MPKTLIALAVAAALVTGCSRRWTPVTHVESHQLANAVAPQQMRAAIVQGLQGRRYRIEQDTPGRIVGIWEKGRVWFRVAVTYDARGFQIAYLGSDGLRIREEESGEVFVEARYGKWANALNRTIQREVQRAHVHQGTYTPGPSVTATPSDTTVVAPVTVEVPTMAPSDGQSAPSLSCCIEGEFFACPSEAAFDACTQLDASQCSRVEANDGACS